MKWTVTFETVTRNDTGRVVSRVIDEKATKKFNTKHEAVEYLRSEGFGGYVYPYSKLPDYMDTYHRGCNNYVVAEITH